MQSATASKDVFSITGAAAAGALPNIVNTPVDVGFGFTGGAKKSSPSSNNPYPMSSSEPSDSEAMIGAAFLQEGGEIGATMRIFKMN